MHLFLSTPRGIVIHSIVIWVDTLNIPLQANQISKGENVTDEVSSNPSRFIQDLTTTEFQVSADKKFVLLAYNIRPVSFLWRTTLLWFIRSKKRHQAFFCLRKTPRVINHLQILSKTCCCCFTTSSCLQGQAVMTCILIRIPEKHQRVRVYVLTLRPQQACTL